MKAATSQHGTLCQYFQLRLCAKIKHSADSWRHLEHRDLTQDVFFLSCQPLLMNSLLTHCTGNHHFELWTHDGILLRVKACDTLQEECQRNVSTNLEITPFMFGNDPRPNSSQITADVNSSISSDNTDNVLSTAPCP